jgi:hypothetical protein
MEKLKESMNTQKAVGLRVDKKTRHIFSADTDTPADPNAKKGIAK